jgi:hypothetical protein
MKSLEEVIASGEKMAKGFQLSSDERRMRIQ